MGGPSRNGSPFLPAGSGKSVSRPGGGRLLDLAERSSDQARRDMTALMIGRMFKDVVGSNELMVETMLTLKDDPERMEGCIGSFLNILHAVVTGNGQAPHKWKELVDYLANTLNIETPGDL